MQEKKLIILCGPSGSGKTTLARHLLGKMPELSFSISATTRPKRETEQDGKDYHFLTEEQFRLRIKEDAFLEYEEVYQGIFYGTLKSELDRIWTEKKIPILDIDVVGALNIKEKYGPRSLAIFVHPISIDNIHHRLTRRATETTESYEKRVARAEEELELAGRFDKIVYNDTLEHALVKTEEYVYDYLLKDKKMML